ncbi:MAG: hypothetical protein AB7U46_00295 [Paenirhodobacter sp.]|uniref:hypothetical protein n=1 Tax=Paenirhodobacter sp. TaxID=1965326 RepID=UPI003D0C23A6
MWLSCLPETPQSARICAQLQDVLAEQAPGLQIVARPATEAPSAAVSALRLHLDSLRADGISAHLEWHRPGAGWQTGESLSMDVMDRTLNDAMVARFLGQLWERTAPEI